MTERAAILTRARTARAEIAQLFIDAAAWNDLGRTPLEPPLDPDPDGSLRRMAANLDRLLEDA
jgi:hypothetical protein